MKLSKLAKASDSQLHGKDIDISLIACDSRLMGPGGLFGVFHGVCADGEKYINDAVRNGAVALLTDHIIEGVDLPQIVAENPRYAFALCSSVFYHNPSKKLGLVGVTGTNGKTTIAYIIRHIISQVGEKCGMIGTIEYDLCSTVLPSPLTTPESCDFQFCLSKIRESEGKYCVAEVSSHSIDQHRIAGSKFSVGVFTNLSHEHLDYHTSMEEYAGVKKKLFDSLDMSGVAVINSEDPFAEIMVKDTKASIIRVGGAGSDIEIKDAICDTRGTYIVLSIGGAELVVKSPLIGSFNVTNVALAIAACSGIGFGLVEIINSIESFPGVPGRMERFANKAGKTVLVDYAHTEDALQKVLEASCALCRGELIVVFGCGGDRDKGKRPLMAKWAEEIADKVYITSDNPRNEDPENIIKEILEGIRNKDNCIIEVDRKKAIEMAIKNATDEDVILIAGKGHEDYQIIGGEKIQLDDREIVKAALS